MRPLAVNTNRKRLWKFACLEDFIEHAMIRTLGCQATVNCGELRHVYMCVRACVCAHPILQAKNNAFLFSTLLKF